MKSADHGTTAAAARRTIARRALGLLLAAMGALGMGATTPSSGRTARSPTSACSQAREAIFSGAAGIDRTDEVDLGLNVFPNAINNNGVIVGDGGCGAAIILNGGVCHKLQNMIPSGSGYTLQEAKGINDIGQIIAYAQLSTDAGHPVHAVLLTPN